MEDKRKIILDLCAGSGSWSKPYQDHPDIYDVRLITLPDHDVRTYEPPENVYGILAAPPCTHFSGSGAHTWRTKDKDGRTLEDLKIVTACLMIIAKSNPKWWVLENPVGRLKYWLGNPVMYFNPCDYGDAYTKKTCLWGNFREPQKSPVEPIYITRGGKRYSPIAAFTGGKSEKTKRLRSITPPGFARAFFESNR